MGEPNNNPTEVPGHLDGGRLGFWPDHLRPSRQDPCFGTPYWLSYLPHGIRRQTELLCRRLSLDE